MSSARSWPRRAAILVSQDTEILAYLREMMRSFNGSVVDATADCAVALDLIRRGVVHLVILQDRNRVGSAVLQNLRTLQRVDASVLTPTLVILDADAKAELPVLEAFPQVGTVLKPLSPSRLAPVMSQLLRIWESPQHTTLRHCFYGYRSGDDRSAYASQLSRLSEVKSVCSLAHILLARLHLASGEVQEAEQILLTHLNRNLSDLGCFHELLSLYQAYEMPRVVVQLIDTFRHVYPGSRMFEADYLWATLRMMDYRQAYKTLQQMIDHDVLQAQCLQILAQMHLSLGNRAQAKPLLRRSEDHDLEVIMRAWGGGD